MSGRVSGILAGLSMGYKAGEFLGAYTVKEQKIPEEGGDGALHGSDERDRHLAHAQGRRKAGDMTRHFLFKILGGNEEIDNVWDAITEMAQQ